MHWSLIGSPAAAPRARSVLRRLEGHRGEVLHARWLRDGSVLSCGADWTMRHWDPASGACLRTFEDPARMHVGFGGIRGALQLADGRVLSWGHDGFLLLWELDKPHPVARVPAHTQAIAGLVLVDERRCVTWSGDGVVRLGSLEPPYDGVPLPYSPTADGMIGLTPTFVLDGARALVGWDYTNLTSVPLDDPDAVITVQAGDADIEHAIRLRSGELITAAEDGRIRAWALPGLDAALEYQPLPTGPSGLCELADGRFAAWYAGRVAVFRPGRAEPETVLDPVDPIVDVRAAPDGGIVYRTLDQRVASWDSRHRWSVSHDDGREPFRMLAPSRDEVLLWSVHERWVLHAQPLGSALVTLGGGSVYGVALHPAWPSRSHAIGWGDGGEVAVWDLAQATARTAAVPASAIHGLVSTSPGELVAWHEAGELSVHAAGSGACLRTLARREPGQRWRPHGALLAPERRLLLWTPTDTIEVWDLDTEQLVGQLTERDGPVGPTALIGPALAVSWSSLREDSGFLLWELAGVRPIAVLAHEGPARGVAPAIDSTFVTWAGSPVLKQWSATGALLETIAVHDAPVRGAAITPHGLVSWTSSHEASVWRPGHAPRRLLLPELAGEILDAASGPDNLLIWAANGALVRWTPASDRTHVQAHRARGGVVLALPLPGDRWLVGDRSGTLALCGDAGAEARAMPPNAVLARAVVTDDARHVAVPDGRRVLLLALTAGLPEVACLELDAQVTSLRALVGGRLALGLASGDVRIASDGREATRSLD